MMDAAHSFDCLIVGAGPAGSTMAARLAEWGHKVALCDSGVAGGFLPEELVPADASPTLKRHGVMSSVRAHGFVGPRARGLIWGDGEFQWTEASVPNQIGDRDERGFRIRRRTFDADLRRLATATGATFFENTRVLGPLPEEGRGTVRIVDAEGEERSLLVRQIAFAGGRSPSPELLPTALRRQLPRMTTLGTTIACPNVDAPLAEASIIESVPEGWLWWLPLSIGRVWIGLHCDPDEMKARGPGRHFDEALSHARGPAAECRGAYDAVDEAGPPAPYPGYFAASTPRLLDTPTSVLLVGDAASTLDPLTGGGIEKALVSGEHAAVSVNTLLSRPQLRDLALAHHRQFEARVWDEQAQRTMRRYLEETRFSDRPFWADRHAQVRVEIEATPDPSQFPKRLRMHPSLRELPALMRRGSELVETKGFALPHSDEPLATLGRVPLAPLMDQLTRHPKVDGLLDRSARDARLYLVSRGQVLRALTELLDRGMIVAVREGDDRG